MVNLVRFLKSVMLVAVGFGIATYFLPGTWHRKDRAPKLPQSMEPPKFDETMIPSMPPVSLNANAVDAFIRWVAATPVSKTQLVRDAISAARGDDEVLGALVARLFELPVKDFGRHEILLSIIGELRRPEAFGPLLRFVNLRTSVL